MRRLTARRRPDGMAVTCSLIMAFCMFMALSGIAAAKTVSGDTGSALGGNMFNAVVLIAHNMGSSIEPISILLVEACVALASKVAPDTFGRFADSLGFMNNTVVDLVIILLFIILKVPKSIGITRIFGIAVEDIENNAMAVFNFALPFMMYFISGDEAAKSSSAALSLGAGSAMAGNLQVAGGIILCTLIGIYLVISYYVMRMVMYAGDVLVSVFSPIPMVSVICEIVKTGAVIGVVALSLFAPWVLIGLYAVTLIICIILFRKAWGIIRYFRKIYIFPFFVGKLKRKALEEKFRRDYADKHEAVLPAVAMTDIGPIKKYSLIKVYVRSGKLFVSPKSGSSDIVIDQLTYGNLEIRKHIRFLEILSSDPGGKKNRKRLSIVISRAYSGLYRDLADSTGFAAADK